MVWGGQKIAGASTLEELEQSMKSNSEELCKGTYNFSKHSKFLRGEYIFSLQTFF